MTTVSAAVINWNNRDQILTCLESLFAQRDIVLSVVLLDNGSTDGSLALIRSRFPELSVIENGRNLGFAVAHNIGYRATAGEWHLVLNSDVVLEPDYIARLLGSCQSDPTIGAGSGKLLRPKTGLSPAVIDSVGMEFFRSRRVWDRGTGEGDLGQYDQEKQVFGCCGAAALYRRTMLSEMAPDGEIFPEIYFAYYEDVDLAWRMNLAGWRSIFVPNAVAHHVRGGSTRGPARTRSLVFRNRYILMARNDRMIDVARDFGPIARFEAFQFVRVLRHPSLLFKVPAIFVNATRACRQKRTMKKNGRRLFGISAISNLVSEGSGVSGWMRQVKAESRISVKTDEANLP